MRKLYLFLCLLTMSVCSLQAQYYEGGITVGASNYIGDLSEGKLKASEYNLSLGIMMRYNLNKYIAFKGSFTKATLTGDDANNSVVSGLRERNLSFRSSLFEFALTNEFNITPYEIRAGKTAVPYVFAGIAGFYFNPQAQFKGNWYDLQPLGTEGQEVLNTSVKKYKRIAIAIPVGLGFKFSLSNRINIGLEVGLRKTITDYIDDVSGNYPDIEYFRNVDPLAATLSFRTPEYYNQPLSNPEGIERGDDGTQDMYFMGGLSVTINLTDKYGLEWDEKYKIFGE